MKYICLISGGKVMNLQNYNIMKSFKKVLIIITKIIKMKQNEEERKIKIEKG